VISCPIENVDEGLDSVSIPQGLDPTLALPLLRYLLIGVSPTPAWTSSMQCARCEGRFPQRTETWDASMTRTGTSDLPARDIPIRFGRLDVCRPDVHKRSRRCEWLTQPPAACALSSARPDRRLPQQNSNPSRPQRKSGSGRSGQHEEWATCDHRSKLRSSQQERSLHDVETVLAVPGSNGSRARPRQFAAWRPRALRWQSCPQGCHRPCGRLPRRRPPLAAGHFFRAQATARVCVRSI